MEEIEGQYIIVEFVDMLEKTKALAEKSGISGGAIDEIQTVHDEMVALEAFLNTEAHYKQLKETLEALLDDLLVKCRKGDEEGTLGNIAQIRGQVQALHNSGRE